MARRRYLVAYDIADPRRLRHICKLMKGYGDRLQYSVFICDLSRSELVHARRRVETVMQMAEDSVVIVDLGAPDDASFVFIGKHRPLPAKGPRIV